MNLFTSSVEESSSPATCRQGAACEPHQNCFGTSLICLEFKFSNIVIANRRFGLKVDRFAIQIQILRQHVRQHSRRYRGERGSQRKIGLSLGDLGRTFSGVYDDRSCEMRIGLIYELIK